MSPRLRALGFILSLKVGVGGPEGPVLLCGCVVFRVCFARQEHLKAGITLGALVITDSILGVPYYNYGIMGPNILF